MLYCTLKIRPGLCIPPRARPRYSVAVTLIRGTVRCWRYPVQHITSPFVGNLTVARRGVGGKRGGVGKYNICVCISASPTSQNRIGYLVQRLFGGREDGSRVFQAFQLLFLDWASRGHLWWGDRRSRDGEANMTASTVDGVCLWSGAQYF